MCRCDAAACYAVVVLATTQTATPRRSQINPIYIGDFQIQGFTFRSDLFTAYFNIFTPHYYFPYYNYNFNWMEHILLVPNKNKQVRTQSLLPSFISRRRPAGMV